jgi:hypothetical protein
MSVLTRTGGVRGGDCDQGRLSAPTLLEGTFGGVLGGERIILRQAQDDEKFAARLCDFILSLSKGQVTFANSSPLLAPGRTAQNRLVRNDPHHFGERHSTLDSNLLARFVLRLSLGDRVANSL